MKGLIICAALVLACGFSLAQTDENKHENQPKIKEVPAAASHGKTVSDLAKNTAGGPEKGKIISTAARQRGIEQKENNSQKENLPSAGKSNRQSHEIRGKGPSGKGNHALPTRNVPPSKSKPGGFSGG